jgi:hypothetical protein
MFCCFVHSVENHENFFVTTFIVFHCFCAVFFLDFFQLRITCPNLVFVCSVGIPKSVGRNGILYAFNQI